MICYNCGHVIHIKSLVNERVIMKYKKDRTVYLVALKHKIPKAI